MLLSTDRLVKSFGTPVLKEISISIREGETVALVGANGAGKSTLLKTLVGLLLPDAGSVTVFGRLLSHQLRRHERAAIRNQIGFVFQNHGLVKRQTALTNVLHGRMGNAGGWRSWHQAIAPHDWREDAVSALAAVRLAERADSRADRLSGGQQQRVAIARALIRRPRLLIADEPAASLDPSAGHEVMQTFADIAKRTGTTLIFTSHDMEHALSYSRRVVALKQGRVFLDASSAEMRPSDLVGVFDD